MKAPATFFNLNQQSKCVKQLSDLLFSLFSRPLVSHFISTISHRTHLLVRACQAIHVTLRVGFREMLGNNRTLAALFLMLVVAPFTGGMYKLFDPHAVVAGAWYSPNDYYGNYRYLLLGIQGNLLCFFSILGIFFLFPAKYKTSYLLSAPLGYIVADAFKKVLSNTNDEYNSITPIPYIVLGICFLVGFMMAIDYLLYRHHHIKRKYWSHIVGLIKMPGVPAETKIQLLEKEIKQVEDNYYAVH